MTHRLTFALIVIVAAGAAAVALARPASRAPAGDGSIPASLSPFDDRHAGVTRLAPALRTAIREAARDARRDGITPRITSGWRSARHQRELLDAAITTYGSEDVARRYVSTPEKSAHVTGDAVDVGATDAAYWVIQHGARYGLCQTYANEVWHFELAVEPGGSCPAPRADAASG